MRAHRALLLLGAAAAIVACSYMGVGEGGTAGSPEDSGAPIDDSGPIVDDDAADVGTVVVVPGEDAACGPDTCGGCCLEGQCQPGTSIDLCGQGGIACTICRDDSGGGSDDAGHDEDSGEHDSGVKDAGHDAGTDAGHDAGTDAGHDAGTDAGHDAGHDAGTDAGLPFGAKCTASAQCGAAYPSCEAVPPVTDGGLVCTKACTKATQDAGCPKPPTNGLCAATGYCE